MRRGEDLETALERARAGGAPKYHDKARDAGKLFCRERLGLLLDEDSFVEDALLANSRADDLPADGVVTGSGRIAGRGVCVMANDSTVKAGSWGARTVEKILRIQERAERLRVPLVYLVDSAGARITDQIQMFPGRRGAGRIFHNQCRLSGMIPQVCLLFGPSAAGGAYIPAFCDVVFMVEGNASMYLGSPRMAEMVIGQKTTLEEMGGAKMHCSVSGCGDLLVKSEPEAIEAAQRYLGYLPGHAGEFPPEAEAREPALSPDDLASCIPREENKLFDMREVIDRLVDADSFFEIKRLFAGELLTGFARIQGRPVGIVANQPKVKGGVLFVDSADKAARFIWLCDAFGIPLVFLADVPGFRRQDDHGRVRGHGAAHQRDRAQGLRRGAVRHEWSRLRAGGDAGAAHGDDRGDGARGGRERRVLQSPGGASGRGTGGRGREAARRIPRRHRHRAPGQRTRGGRDHRARFPAPRSGRPPARSRLPPRPRPRQTPQHHSGLRRLRRGRV